MSTFNIFPKKSLLFAPMEGVTDEAYRIALLKTFPEWDQFYTDFFRVPTVGKVSERSLIEHLGERIYANAEWKKKNSFQILTSSRSQTQSVVEILEALEIHHLDLNIGCPSRTVNSHFGGAYLLSNHVALKEILKTIRSHFTGTFTVKMRIGYRDDKNFFDSLKLIEDSGVEAITLHARTRDQLYKGIADWNYITQAVSTVKIPVIGNGDIWTLNDIEKIFTTTSCHSVMLGRSALKTPWMPKLYHNHSEIRERKKYLELYFNALLTEYRELEKTDLQILKRFKAFSRHPFEDYPEGEIIRGRFLRAESLGEFLDRLYAL